MAPITLVNDSALSVTLTEAGGNATLAVVPNVSVGGGNVAGFVSLGGSINLNIKGSILEAALFQYLEAKYPAAAPELAGVKAIVDAAVATI